MTGRSAGYCAGYPRAGWQNSVPGRLGGAFRRGWGFCGSLRGFARGRKYRESIPSSREALQAQRNVLRCELDNVEQQLSAIDDKEDKK
jgi:hypothetical protein